MAHSALGRHSHGNAPVLLTRGNAHRSCRRIALSPRCADLDRSLATSGLPSAGLWRECLSGRLTSDIEDQNLLGVIADNRLGGVAQA